MSVLLKKMSRGLIFLPLLIAAILVRWGGAPGIERVREDLQSTDKHRVERAIDYMRESRRKGYAKLVEPLIFSESQNSRKEALRALGSFKLRESNTVLAKALDSGLYDREDILDTMIGIGHVGAIKYTELAMDGEDAELAHFAFERETALLNYINPKARFYTYPNNPYVRMGQIIYSQRTAVDKEINE